MLTTTTQQAMAIARTYAQRFEAADAVQAALNKLRPLLKEGIITEQERELLHDTEILIHKIKQKSTSPAAARDLEAQLNAVQT